MTKNHHILTVPSDTRYLRDVRQFIAGHAHDANFAPAVVEQLKLAVDEACTNVMKHAYQGKKDEEIDIRIEISGKKLKICIRDNGIAFDALTYHEPDIGKSIKARIGGGLGIHLMRTVMDDVKFTSKKSFNEVCMTKNRG